jgi:hypothetical protein
MVPFARIGRGVLNDQRRIGTMASTEPGEGRGSKHGKSQQLRVALGLIKHQQ